MDVLNEIQEELLKQINNAFKNFKKKGTAKMTRVSAQTRLNGLEEWYTQITTNHKKILLRKDIPRDHDYFKQNLYEQALDSYFDRKGEFLEFLEELKKAEVERNPPTASVEIPQYNVRTTITDSHSLPKMNLPKFSGNFSEWENFRDLYRSVVHRRSDLDASIKYYYLRTHLHGEGLEHIKAIAIAAEHYDRAWSTLVDYYDNKRHAISTLIKKILSVKPMKTESASELKRVSTEILSPFESLSALGRTEADIGNDLIVHLVVQQFDAGTKKDWKKSLDTSSDTPPTIRLLKEFVNSQLETLDSLEENTDSSPVAKDKKNSKAKQSKTENEASTTHSFQTITKESSPKLVKCLFCCADHALAKCEQYQKRPVSERRDFAKVKHLCYNCLAMTHSKGQCKSRFNCFTCRGRHHTLLHVDSQDGGNQSEKTPNTVRQGSDRSHVNFACSSTTLQDAPIANAHSTLSISNTGVLLATAQLIVIGPKNRQLLVRALVDPYSQVSVVSQGLCNQLALDYKTTHVCIKGVGQNSSTIANKLATFSLTPHFSSSFRLNVEALVLPKLSSYIPPAVPNADRFKHLQGLQLADPDYARQSRIDILLGAGVYADIVESSILKGADLEPIAISSKLGWLVTGKVSTMSLSSKNQAISQSISVFHCSCADEQQSELSRLLQEFWRTEEVGNKNSCSVEELQCEELFESSTFREPSGRYVVRLPWKEPNKLKEIKLGSSFHHAFRALKRLEANFSKDERLRLEYTKFMREYLELGHMTAAEGELPSEHSDYFFLPHHGVWKESSSTTKLRTVFNGSSKLDSGESLNDLLYSGKNLLKHPVEHICVVRNYAIALSADVEKMFRQTGVDKRDRKFQTIIWRFNPLEKLKVFLLNTTYGLTCSSYLAMCTLLQMAKDHEQEYPIAAAVVRDEMYSDNVLTGAHSTKEAVDKMSELIRLFQKAQMNLRKWSSSDQQVLSNLPQDMLALDEVTLFDSDAMVPMLGISWHTRGDFFRFHVEAIAETKQVTKRNMLSRIARIFDPLGWLAPVIILAKLVMQSLWLTKINWDEAVPQNIELTWSNWIKELPLISDIKIPRWTGFTPQTEIIEVHGFADASKLAYGAVIYLRLVQNPNIKVTLQVAKSKVAPIKTLSIPRLELCAALILTRLTKQFLDSTKLKIDSVHLWSDSADVLFWLRDHPSRWNVFIGNRCSEIHTSLPDAFWHHVRSADNPADLVSHGVMPSKLHSLEQWWKGPHFLANAIGHWPRLQDDLNFSINSVITASSYQVTVDSDSSSSTEKPVLWYLVERYSSLSMLLRVTALCIRFISRVSHSLTARRNRQYQLLKLEFFSKMDNRETKHIGPDELENSKAFWYYLIQLAYFKDEYSLLSNGRKLSHKSPLANLNPYLQGHLIRVGGRLAHSLIPDRAKHPVVLPRNSPFNTLMIRQAHLRTMHGGTQLTLATLRQEVWILRGRTEVRKVIKSCMQCIRYAGQVPTQIMGELPRARVQPSHPFEKSGVDYAGPINVRLTKTRGKGTLKGYVCVFVCMVTRAVHLELVEDYTSDAFIAAFHRFTARRGQCRELYSDQGTNFVGADAQLRQMLSVIKTSEFVETVSHTLSNLGTAWKFNPPSAPHFGGLWEAAVKSLKFHARRVIGDQTLTFSVLATLLCRIEACLNSRPLVKMTDDPSDLNYLTPAHFLIQRDSYLVPEPDLTKDNVPLGKRWRLLSQMTQHFWTKWR